MFVADLAGAPMLGSGIHTLTVESSGGDGCIEIDLIRLRPDVTVSAPRAILGRP